MTLLTELPKDLPIPVDDGACYHLPGLKVPPTPLVSTHGRTVDIGSTPGCVVVYCYPMTGRPGVPLPDGWDHIPGARGCTPQSCSFRNHHQEINALGAVVYGVSTQSTDYQQEAAARLHLPFELLSDEAGMLQRALNLPTFHANGNPLLKRVTLIIRDGVVEKVFYPVFPPDQNAQRVIDWLTPPTTGSLLAC